MVRSIFDTLAVCSSEPAEPGLHDDAELVWSVVLLFFVWEGDATVPNGLVGKGSWVDMRVRISEASALSRKEQREMNEAGSQIEMSATAVLVPFRVPGLLWIPALEGIHSGGTVFELFSKSCTCI
jgi:hypothetical protein